MALVSEKMERMRKLAEAWQGHVMLYLASNLDGWMTVWEAMQQEEDEENKMFELPEEGLMAFLEALAGPSSGGGAHGLPACSREV